MDSASTLGCRTGCDDHEIPQFSWPQRLTSRDAISCCASGWYGHTNPKRKRGLINLTPHRCALGGRIAALPTASRQCKLLGGLACRVEVAPRVVVRPTVFENDLKPAADIQSRL